MLTRKLKIINNKKLKYVILSFIVLCCIVCFALSPKYYMQQTLLGLEVFAKNVFPSLFPFFVFSKILTGLNCVSDFARYFGKATNKLYNTSGISAYAFTLAIISGYPVGAKVVSELYEQKQLTQDEVNRVITFTSTSGPLFIIGTVGVGMLNSFKCGVIMLVCHIIASLLNGLIYRNKGVTNKKIYSNYQTDFIAPDINKVISESVFNSIISILNVGAYIVIFFVLISLINSLHLLTPICFILNKIGFSYANANAFLNGIVEITRGCLDISKLNISLRLKTILCGTVISFGGFSVAFQGFAFLSKCKVKFGFFIKQKITHCFLSVILLCLFCFLI